MAGVPVGPGIGMKTPKPGSPDPEPKEKMLDKAWKIDSAMGLARQFLRGSLPAFESTISVTVQGGPEADMRRLWYLALAAAFGRYRNAPKTSYQQMDVNSLWDITGKLVKIDLHYQCNSLVQFANDNPGIATGVAAGMVLGPVGGIIAGVAVGTVAAQAKAKEVVGANPTADPVAYLHRGPEQVTIGDTWPVFLSRGEKTKYSTPYVWILRQVTASRKVGGPIQCIQPIKWQTTLSMIRDYPSFDGENATFYPYAVLSPQTDKGTILAGKASVVPGADLSSFPVPALPDAGRIITSAEKRDPRMCPPTPPVDGSTRGSLVSLVAAALQSPCFLVPCPSSTDGNPVLASSGAWAFTSNGVPEGATPGSVATAASQLRGQNILQPVGPITQSAVGGVMPKDIYTFQD